MTDDFIRTRLTHSLEVAQVGRELGSALGCDPDVVDTACLAHDLGHPPFGHNGERVLAEVANDIGGFEGNAQTLRLLTRLEAKVFDDHGRSVGLNLTRASLDAATKYPWIRGEAPPGFSPEKFGVYGEDEAIFRWMREDTEPGERCVEAQIMDLADDIAYSVHDVEDAVVGAGVSLAVLADSVQRLDVLYTAQEAYLPGSQMEELSRAADRLVSLDYWVRGYDGSRRALADLKNMTSQLIGRFCMDAVRATRARFGDGPLTRYAGCIVTPPETLAEIAVLKALAAVYVMRPRNDDDVYSRQREIVRDLYYRLVEIAPLGLEVAFRDDWDIATSDAARRRVVVDQVASLTDTSAVILHTHYVQRG